ncbi:endonuclease/exonuclease/phosphatase family protein [Nocardiopsis sp. JB363]|uniref:endonuclease/exonuclease/phosphatase family protein n=1 Tax=Nocardiopsis sp. JB363 TaxID=1434837 RepID=UPI00097B3877|nr:endonuclease/exonuclease/phosphatase family protein [Nocardiopsis sp. JB363]SIO87197.1 hypothetical protein BQ8420_15395 [Nocardiopsis sp. JB363]
MSITIRGMSANVWRSGVWTPERTPQNRIPALCEAITAQSPHLLGVQEADDWAKNDGLLLAEVEERLGLSAVKESFLPDRSTGLLYDPTVMDLVEWEPAPGQGWQGFTGTARFDLGLEYSIAVIVVHLSHQSAPWALHQASLVNDRARRVSDRRQAPGAVRAEAALVFGDVNQPGLYHSAAPPDPRPQELPACNLAYRFTGMPGQEVVNRDVAELFARCRWTDLALHLADQSTDPGEQAQLMASTAHNGGFSIDRVYLTESVVPAARTLKQVDIPSDHRALVWEIDPARIDPAVTTRLHV